MLAALDDNAENPPMVLAEARKAGMDCDAAGWSARPSWQDLSNGSRPPDPDPDETTLGEWIHGWQYHASNSLEHAAFTDLMRDVALPSRRRNAQATGKSRLMSCRGRFSAAWLTAYPGTGALEFQEAELQSAMRLRLGLATCLARVWMRRRRVGSSKMNCF